MADSASLAEALQSREPAALKALQGLLIRPKQDNFVARPWGGTWLRAFKGCQEQPGEPTVGESFEISAWPSDPEARQFPRIIPLADGSEISLSDLLAAADDVLLGSEFLARYPHGFPLLPKLLDIKELLSVQGHPEGNTEVYVIINAEPQATIRLGFCSEIDPAATAQRLKAALKLQRQLMAALPGDTDLEALQRNIAPWLAERGCDIDRLPAVISDSDKAARLCDLAEQLHETYWWMLEQMNEISVQPGQVILNANPPSVIAGTGRQPSAEVHALGNPQRREILALEIRKPGPTFRAWDNVRFPPRAVDVDAALQALSLKATQPEQFIVDERQQTPDGNWRVSIDCAEFAIEHLVVERATATIDVTVTSPQVLHVLGGSIAIETDEKAEELNRGESAIVPLSLGQYRLTATEDAQLIKVVPKLNIS